MLLHIVKTHFFALYPWIQLFLPRKAWQLISYTECKHIPSPISHVVQYSAPDGVLPPLHSQLQRPAGLSCGSCCDGLLLSSSSPSGPASGLCALPGLPEPPGPTGVCLQAARTSGAPTAHHHPADVPGILGHGQSLSAFSMNFCFSLV